MTKQEADILPGLLEMVANSKVRAIELGKDSVVRTELDGASIEECRLLILLLRKFVVALDGITPTERDRLEIEARLDLREARTDLDANKWRLDEMSDDSANGFAKIASWTFHAAVFLPIARKVLPVIKVLREPAPRRGSKVDRCLLAMVSADKRVPGMFAGWTDQQAIEWAKNNGHPISINSLQRKGKNRDCWLALKKWNHR